MALRHRSKTNPEWTVLEEEVFGRITFFQAQVIRDAFEERSSNEGDQSIADRLSLPLELIQKCRCCRFRHLIPAEITSKDMKEILKHYRSPLERLDRPVERPEQLPRAVRLGLALDPSFVALLIRE